MTSHSSTQRVITQEAANHSPGKGALLPDERRRHPIRALQQTPAPAFIPRAANEKAAVITNSLHCKGEWRSYCGSLATPCFFTWPEITLFIPNKRRWKWRQSEEGEKSFPPLFRSCMRNIFAPWIWMPFRLEVAVDPED